MSIGLENLVNVTGVSSDYPWKDIKDDTGAGDGTPLDQISHSDYHQTFRKLLDLAGIIPNGLPDNVSNGFQYLQAFDRLYKNYRGTRGLTVSTALTVSDVSKIILTGGSGTVTHTMPDSTTLQDGDSITLLNVGSGTFAVVEFLGDAIINNPGVFTPGDYITLALSKGLNSWFVVDYKKTDIPIWVTPTSELGANFTIPGTFTSNPNVFQYRKNNLNELEFRGFVKCVSGAGSSILLTLPVGFIPVHFKQFSIYNSNGTSIIAYLDQTTGELSINTLATNNLYSLEQIKISLD